MKSRQLFASLLVLIVVTICQQFSTSDADCSAPVDLAFVVDGSGICESNYDDVAAADNGNKGNNGNGKGNNGNGKGNNGNGKGNNGGSAVVSGNSSTCFNWELVCQFMVDIVIDMDIGPQSTRVGLIMFGTTATVGWNYSRYHKKADLLAAIKNLKYPGGKRDMVGGLRLLGNMVGRAGDRPGVRNKAIIITAGNPTVLTGVSSAISSVHELGCQTYAVGITSYINEATVKGLCSPPRRAQFSYFMVPSFLLLTTIRIELKMSVFCNAPVIVNSVTPTLGYQSTSPPTTRSTSLQTVPPMTTKAPTPPAPSTSTPQTTTTTVTTTVQIASTLYNDRTPPEYRECQPLDLVFVVDGSGSICDCDSSYRYGIDTTCNNWSYMLQFMIDIVNAMKVGTNDVRVGVVKFATGAEVEFRLDQYTTKDDVINAIKNLQYPFGTTNTSGGLNVMRSEVFGVQGDRPDVRNVAIIMTDGMPSAPLEVPSAIEAVHNQNIVTYTVGVTTEVDEGMLKTLSSSPQVPDQNYFVSNDFESMGKLSTALTNEFCSSTTA